MVKLQQIKDKSFYVILPRQIVLAKEWKKGDKIGVFVNKNGHLELRY